MKFYKQTLVVCCALGALMLGSALPVFGATCTVTNTNDTGSGSLRNCIQNAASGDSINFSLTYPATITLTSGGLNVSTSLTISGPGASKVTVSGNNALVVFTISSGITVNISGLTIADGTAYYPPAYSNWAGGIINSGKLNLSDSTVKGNTGEFGTGAYNNGVLTVKNSTFTGNSTDGDGAAIYNDSTGTLAITTSTVSGNSGPHNSFYPSYAGVGIFSAGPTSINNTTVSANSGDGIQSFVNTRIINTTVYANQGQGVLLGSAGTGTVVSSTIYGNYNNGFASQAGGTGNIIKNTILANNGVLYGHNCFGNPFASGGYNLSSDDSCSGFLNATGDLNNIGAGLDPGGLQSNGGPTQTLALLSTSPAVDAIPTAACTDTNNNPVATDQRGVSRPQSFQCDIGAYELVLDDNDNTVKGDLTVNGNQTDNGGLTATTLAGNGFGLTNLDPTKLTSGTAGISITGQAGSVMNGVYTSGSYMDPNWIMTLAGAKITGAVASANTANFATSAGSAGSSAAAAVLTGPTVQCGTNNFATGIMTNGNANCLQPASTNLTDGSGLVRQTQILFSSGGVGVGVGWYVGLAGTNNLESNVQQIVAVGGTIVGMQCFVQTAPASGTATYTVRQNGASTGAVCTIVAGSTKGSVTGLSISFAAGDLLDILAGGPHINKPVTIAVAVTP